MPKFDNLEEDPCSSSASAPKSDNLEEDPCSSSASAPKSDNLEEDPCSSSASAPKSDNLEEDPCSSSTSAPKSDNLEEDPCSSSASAPKSDNLEEDPCSSSASAYQPSDSAFAQFSFVTPVKRPPCPCPDCVARCKRNIAKPRKRNYRHRLIPEDSPVRRELNFDQIGPKEMQDAESECESAKSCMVTMPADEQGVGELNQSEDEQMELACEFIPVISDDDSIVSILDMADEEDEERELACEFIPVISDDVSILNTTDEEVTEE